MRGTRRAAPAGSLYFSLVQAPRKPHAQPETHTRPPSGWSRNEGRLELACGKGAQAPALHEPRTG